MWSFMISLVSYRSLSHVACSQSDLKTCHQLQRVPGGFQVQRKFLHCWVSCICWCRLKSTDICVSFVAAPLSRQVNEHFKLQYSRSNCPVFFVTFSQITSIVQLNGFDRKIAMKMLLWIKNEFKIMLKKHEWFSWVSQLFYAKMHFKLPFLSVAQFHNKTITIMWQMTNTILPTILPMQCFHELSTLL